MSPFPSIAVIGGGAWGSALAHLAASNGVDTLIWAREEAVAASINQTRENAVFLPGVQLHEGVRATNSLEEAGERPAILFVAPVQFARAVLADLKPHAHPETSVALCSKGIELKTNLLMTEIFAEVWPEALLAVLSGPSFAHDVAKGLPTAVTLACPDEAVGAQWAASLAAPHFRPYRTDDLVGAEVGGAIKNVLAIAAGAVEGKGLGESARAAIIARGFAEFSRLGVALGAKPETMAGLSGLGDLILTATSTRSRNMSLGLALGQGKSLEEILGERQSVSEGVATAAGVVALGARLGVDLPVCRAVADLVAGARTIDEIIHDLLARPLKEEG